MDSIYIILIFFAEKMRVLSYSQFFSKKFQHICVSLDVNFKESLTNDIVSFEQLGPGGQVISAPNFGSQGPGFESHKRRNSAHDYAVSLHRALHYHPSSD